MLTYGDGVSNVNIEELMDFHRSHGRIATVTAVRPPARFGGLVLEGDQVRSFTEKPVSGEGWINGGFLVFEPEIFDYLKGDTCSLEADALKKLPLMASWPPTDIPISGSAWTRFAIANIFSVCGIPERPLADLGKRPREYSPASDAP